MFKVETYTNPLMFYNSLEVRMDELHITSIPILAMHIKERAIKEGKHLRWNVIIYHHFYGAIYQKWNNQKYLLDMKQILRHIIRTDEQFKDKKEVLLKQVQSLCDTYRYWLAIGLLEINVESSDNEFEKLKVALYHQFKEVQEIKKSYEILHKPLTFQYVSNCLEGFTNKQEQRVAQQYFDEIKRIYIYALNDLNPIRFKFLKNLCDAGYEVIFRIPYDEQYSHVYAGWEELYSQVVPKEQWQVIQQNKKNSSVLDFLEGKQVVNKQDKKVILHQYTEPTLFKRYLREHELDKSKLELLACEEDHINEAFRDEIDGEKEVSHIFETPIGHFISHLYNVKYVEHHKRMTYEMYQEMITSGIINVSQTKEKVISGIEGTSLLSDLKSYMKGVTSLGEIKERLYKLKKLYDISEEFDDLARSKVDGNHVKRYLQNPMRVFGFIKPQGYSLTIIQLIMLTEELEKQLEVLLHEYSPIQKIEEHINYLVKLIKSSIAYKECDVKLERVYEGFLEKFMKFKGTLYENEELNEYIAILGKVPSLKHQKGELVLVKGIDHALGVCVNGVEAVYLCDLSTTAMNHYIDRRQGRIEMRSIEGLNKYIERIQDTTVKTELIQIMHLARLVKKHIQSFIKFNLMTLLTYYSGTLHLGWIKNMYPYDTEWYLLSIIKQIYTVQDAEEEEETIEWLEEEKEEKSNLELPKEQVQKIANQLSPFAWEDMKQCKKKFYYSNILNHYPVYQEDFTQRIAFGWLGKLMQDYYDGNEQVTKQFYPLYPQWTDALKQNLIDTTPVCKLAEYIAFDNIKFPKNMVSLWCLGKKKYNELSLKEKGEFLQQYLKRCERSLSAEEVSKKCYFCPHQLICQEGAFVVDGEY